MIIGGGAAGKLIAWTFAAKGQRVAMIERKYVGGSCTNIACLPSKNIIHTAQIVSYVRTLGLHVLFASAPTKRPKRNSS